MDLRSRTASLRVVDAAKLVLLTKLKILEGVNKFSLKLSEGDNIEKVFWSAFDFLAAFRLMCCRVIERYEPTFDSFVGMQLLVRFVSIKQFL